MSLIKKLSARLQNHPKRIVYPEGADPRILQAARQFSTRKLGVPILLGKREKISEIAASIDVRLDGMKIIDPVSSDDFGELCRLMKAFPRFKALDDDGIRNLVSNPNYYSTLMVASGRADAMLAGATTVSSGALRPIFQIIPLQKGFKTASSIMILSTGRPEIGADGDLFLADCGVIPEPDERQLCDIALTTGMLANQLTLQTPRIAMLSFSSKASTSAHPSVVKVKAATALAHDKAKRDMLDMEVDGELQIDAALSPEVARLKHISSSVAGKANVLIFPDLDSGNIASKMIRVLAPDIECYGQILTGLTKPAAPESTPTALRTVTGSPINAAEIRSTISGVIVTITDASTGEVLPSP